MKRRNLMAGATALLALGACAKTPSKFKAYDGPEVTGIVVNKADRKMYLLNEGRVLDAFDVSLGFAPEGHKQFEGDGRTPEGLYRINRRNPNSRFHLSLGISYPNHRDKALAAAMGKNPGGDIFIHGQKVPFRRDKGDWTWGCIAIDNAEIEKVYAMVKDGTAIAINP